MARTRIKICGITRPQDALAAASAGADAVGLVFYPPAARNVSVDRAREIVAALPAFVAPVGLFVDSPPQQIITIAAELGLRHVQLNGRESPEELGELRGLAVTRAIRVTAEHFGEDLRFWRDAIARHKLTNLKAIVLETGGTRQAGGTGIENDWETIGRHVDGGNFAGLPAVIAAGGLTPQNVARVVRELRPWGVDVSSGVESAPGQKSAEKIDAFVAAVREADSR